MKPASFTTLSSIQHNSRVKQVQQQTLFARFAQHPPHNTTMDHGPAKEGFRRYLESAGVIDALTKVLVSLYEEPDKPKQGVDYIKACLGGPTPDEYEALLAEREALQRELADARQQLADLEARVQAQASSPQ